MLQVELKTGETYRGTLVESEDNWNSQMKDITVTGRVRGCPEHSWLGFASVEWTPSLPRLRRDLVESNVARATPSPPGSAPAHPRPKCSAVSSVSACNAVRTR